MATQKTTPESKGTPNAPAAAGEAGKQEAQQQAVTRGTQLPIRRGAPSGRQALSPWRRLRERLAPTPASLGLAVPVTFDSPFSLMREMRDEMDRMIEGLDQLIESRDLGFEGQGFSPQIEVSQRGDSFVVRADLPGMKKEDVRVEVLDDALCLEGERKSESREEREGFFRSERSYGSFQRIIPLPEGCDTQNVQASFENGVLEVTLKAPPPRTRGRQVEIQDKAAQSGGPVH